MRALDLQSESLVNRNQGFTLVEIMIVVAIVGLLAVIAMPSYVRAIEASQTDACLNNLRQIEFAKEQWAFENNRPNGVGVVAADIDPYLKRGFAGTEEPTSGTYTIGVTGADPVCSNFDVAIHPSTI